MVLFCLEHNFHLGLQYIAHFLPDMDIVWLLDCKIHMVPDYNVQRVFGNETGKKLKSFNMTNYLRIAWHNELKQEK